jgi:nucleotide-binding universal stress UspA family protein
MMPGDRHPVEEFTRAQARLDRALAEAATRSDVDVTGAVVEGPTAAVLCDLSARAEMLVVGSRGGGGLAGLFLGSVSLAAATHAHCPVVVVPDCYQPQSADRPIAVGIDESAEGQLAVRFAVEEAAVRGVAVLAVRAWMPPTTPWRSDVRPLVADVAELETTERLVVSRALNDWCEKYPDVPVVSRLIPTDARHALATASHDAQLVVVGSRSPDGFADLVLGSVSHYLLHHASCPVAVIRNQAGR